MSDVYSMMDVQVVPIYLHTCIRCIDLAWVFRSYVHFVMYQMIIIAALITMLVGLKHVFYLNR